LFFATDDTSRLVSLLNAIFANKGILRRIESLVIDNPNLERLSKDDKLSTLDVKASLSDGSAVCIEIHLGDIAELKAKAIRNWARMYGIQLEKGLPYTSLKPVICVSFINGPVRDHEGNALDKVHALFQIRERDDGQVLTQDMELHYINMMAAEALSAYSRDKIRLMEYKNRQEDIKFYYEKMRLSEENAQKIEEYAQKIKEYAQKVEENARKAEEANRKAEEANRKAEEANRKAEENARRVEEANIALSNVVNILIKTNSLSEVAKQTNMSEERIKKIIDGN